MPGSFLAKLPFGTLKSAYIWSGIIFTILFLLNFHILVFNGVYETINYNSTDNFEMKFQLIENQSIDLNNHKVLNKTIMTCYKYSSSSFNLFPLWNKVNMFVYSFVPSAIMLIFNCLLIRNILIRKRLIKSSKDKTIQLTISLLVITFKFIILTLVSITTSIHFDYIINITS